MPWLITTDVLALLALWLYGRSHWSADVLVRRSSTANDVCFSCTLCAVLIYQYKHANIQN